MKLENYLKKFLILLINLYQILLSPLFGRNCRYYPSCSQYAKEAIVKKGILKGLLLSGWRILRCNPFSKGGYDPVK
ncbi:membrane protein insertion efficiency factor YidD [Deferribacter thermophilus]|uniref:membrane protein insertion efficiency factor YidD n=1 Tax=Deferribacter thermophilus TaxID=53573 RepID=UPI003C306B2E